MPSSIFFNGRLIRRPGSYSEVDASGLEQVGLSAAGIVALIGEGEGGKPVSDIEEPKDFIRIGKPESAREIFKSGALREACGMAFEPSTDPDIPGGAVEVVAMKVNPATQSSLVLTNAYGDSIVVTSEDYGAFTEQIKISIQTGTTKGKLVAVTFEDQVESQDDVGGDDIFKLKYTKPTNGWDTMEAAVEAGGVVAADATRDVAGLDSDIGTTLAAPGAIEVVSTGADTNQVEIFGLDGTGNPVREVLTLEGTTPKAGTQVFAAGDVLGVKITGTTVGTVSVRPSGGGADVFTVTAGTDKVAGLSLGSTMYMSGAVTIVGDGATTKDVIISGLNASGARLLEKLTLNGTTPVPGAGVFREITEIILGDVEAAVTVTVSGRAAETIPGTHSTIQKVSDYFNGRYIDSVGGFVLTLVSGRTTYPVTQLDVSVSAVSCLDPAEPGFKADLWAIIEYLNFSNELVDAVAASGAVGGAPSNTAQPVFLSGGSEGVTTSADWQKALNLLKKIDINTLVPLTHDPAVHSIVEAHCAYMGGVGRSERDSVVGVKNTAGTDVATKDEVKSQAVDLNSRHTRLWPQYIERYSTALERTEFDPHFGAVVIAGMQAGSGIGTSLTHKYMNILALRQHSSWNPTDDAEEMIAAGVCFAENIDGKGRRVVRNITTHLTSDNLAFTEASVNEAVNYSALTFRRNMEFAVGRQGFAGTVNAGFGVARGTLGLLVDELILVAFRALFIELIADVMEVSAELAPVIPINFVKNTLHLVTIRQTAE